jgi:hypothetical protein
MSLISFCKRSRRSSGRLSRAAFNASGRFTGVVSNFGVSVGVSCADHSGLLGDLKDQNLEIVFSNRYCLNCRVKRRLAIRELGLHFSSFERSFRTRCDLCFDVSQTLAREIQVRELVLLIAQCEHQFPVGLLHARDHVDRALAEVCV